MINSDLQKKMENRNSVIKELWGRVEVDNTPDWDDVREEMENQDNEERLNRDQLHFLVFAKKKFMSVKKDYKEGLNWSYSRLDRVIKILEEKGYIQRFKVKTKHSGAMRWKLLQPGIDEVGKQETGKMGPESATIRDGALKPHSEMKLKSIDPIFEEEYHIGNGEAIDFVALKNGKIIMAAEIGCSSVDQEVHNVEKCLGVDGDFKIFSIGIDDDKTKKIKSSCYDQLDPEELDRRVTFCTPTGFLKLSKDDLI